MKGHPYADVNGEAECVIERVLVTNIINMRVLTKVVNMKVIIHKMRLMTKASMMSSTLGK